MAAVGRPKGPLSDEKKKQQAETRRHNTFLKTEIHPNMDRSLFSQEEFQNKVIASVEYKFPFEVKEAGVSAQQEGFLQLFLEAKGNQIPYMTLANHYEFELALSDFEKMSKELIKAKRAWIQRVDTTVPVSKQVYKYYGDSQPEGWEGYKYKPRESTTHDTQ